MTMLAIGVCDDVRLRDAVFRRLLVFGSQYFGVHLANCDLWPTYGFYNTSIFLCSGHGLELIVFGEDPCCVLWRQRRGFSVD